MTLWEMSTWLMVANLLTFGNGTLMMPLLQRSFVQDAHVLTNEQLLFAFAVARVTPGQANLYLASIGYMLFGFAGSIATILVMAVPSYLMIPLMRGYRHVRDNAYVAGFSRGLASTAVGVVVATTWRFGGDTIDTPLAWSILALTLVLLVFTKLPTFVSLLLASGLGMAAAVALALA